MTQDALWDKRYDEVMTYMNVNHRNPSKHRVEDSAMVNWLKYQRKMLNQDKLKPERKEKMLRLLQRANLLKRKNQWCAAQWVEEQQA